MELFPFYYAYAMLWILECEPGIHKHKCKQKEFSCQRQYTKIKSQALSVRIYHLKTWQCRWTKIWWNLSVITILCKSYASEMPEFCSLSFIKKSCENLSKTLMLFWAIIRLNNRGNFIRFSTPLQKLVTFL